MNAELLKGNILFKDLDDDRLGKFADMASEKEYNAGDIILDEGVEGDALYVIKEGQVEVSKTEDATHSTIVTLEAGEHFGEMSLIESAPTSAKVSADGKVTILVFPREKLLSLLGEDDTMAARVYKALAFTLSRRLRATSADLATWKPSFDF